MDTMTFEVRERTGWLTFTRPESLNSITDVVLGELEGVIRRVEADPSIRTLVLTGQGKAFCVGLDLNLLDGAFSEPVYFKEILRRYHRVLLALEHLGVPVVAAVNGLARAGGFELMLACDLVVLAEEAKVGDNHSPFGVMPGGGSTFRLPARVGEQRAKLLLFTGKWLTAGEAVEIGLALRAVPVHELTAAVEELCRDLVDKPSALHRAIKRAVDASRSLSFAEAVEVELEEFDRYVLGGDEAKEGFTAYREGRSPRWE